MKENINTIVLWEVSQKQNYIFSTNKLKENKGASYIIRYITEGLVNSCFEEYSDNLIYNGGGSSLYGFDSNERAKRFVKEISEFVLTSYDGVELFMVIQDCDIKRTDISDSIDKAYKKLAVKKKQRINSGGQLSFGIEKRCAATGLPAVEELRQDKNRYISSDVRIKLKNAPKYDESLKELLSGNESVDTFSELAGSEKNYMGVIHIDGNKMGRLFENIKVISTKTEDKVYSNREYLKQLKKTSLEVDKLFKEAFKHMVNKIKEYHDSKNRSLNSKVKVVPIIVAGDDITYAVNGNVAIESARIFMEYINKNPIEVNGEVKYINCCAGVSIVKTGHPFVKAYSLAEELCENSKRTLAEEYGGDDYTLIDWHVEQAGIYSSLSDIRKMKYITKDKSNLTMKPLYINNEQNWRNYNNFLNSLKYIRRDENNQAHIARSKVKELRGVLKLGQDETEKYIKVNDLAEKLSDIRGVHETKGNEYSEFCFIDGICTYYDAIELMDIFEKVEEDEK